MIKWDAIIFFHDRVILQITRSEKVVNTFQQCANSIVLEPITQYNNLNVETRSAKGHHSGDRSQAVSRPSSRQSRCNRRIIESARSLRTHTTFIIALISSFSFFPSPSYPSPPLPSLSLYLSPYLPLLLIFPSLIYSLPHPFFPSFHLFLSSRPSSLSISASSYRYKCTGEDCIHKPALQPPGFLAVAADARTLSAGASSQRQHERQHHIPDATDPVYIDCGGVERPQGTLPRLLVLKRSPFCPPSPRSF